MDELINKIVNGDLVDFGHCGEIYVCNTKYLDDYFWVTYRKSDIFNEKYNRGHPMLKSNATGIIETGDN